MMIYTLTHDDIPLLSQWIKNPTSRNLSDFLAAEIGFEPIRAESESAVLPLHNSASFCLLSYYIAKYGNVKGELKHSKGVLSTDIF